MFLNILYIRGYTQGEVTSQRVGQHVVICVVKWRRFVILFEKKIKFV